MDETCSNYVVDLSIVFTLCLFAMVSVIEMFHGIMLDLSVLVGFRGLKSCFEITEPYFFASL